MRPITEWCGVCLQDDVKVVADQVIEQVPLCKGCVLAYGTEKDVLRDARQFLRDMDGDNDIKESDPPPEHPCKCGCGELIPGGDEFAVDHPKKPAISKPAAEPEMKMKVFNRKPAGWTQDDDDFEKWEAKRREVYGVYKQLKDYRAVATQTGLSYSKVYSWCRALAKQEQSNVVEALDTENQVLVTKSRTTREEVREKVTETHEVENWNTGSPRVSKLHIEMPSGGRLSLEWEGHLFEISPEDRAFVFSIADRMRQYAKQKAVSLPPKHFSIVSCIDSAFITDMLDMMDQEEQNQVVEWVAEAVTVVNERRGKR